jgi:hypothetical protein
MIDLKNLLKNKMTDISDFSNTILRAFNLTRCKNVTDMRKIKNHSLGDKLNTGLTTWSVVENETPFKANNGLYLKAIGDVYVEDFNDGNLSQSEYVALANNYCMHPSTNNRLIFDHSKDYFFEKTVSFQIFVESGGWYSSGNCNLYWRASPIQGFAIKIKGRYSYNTDYKVRVNNSNYHPLEGFTIGKYSKGQKGTGLQIGESEKISSMKDAVVTSKFQISRVSIHDFDDAVSIFPGAWAFELHQVNTMGGSWQTPYYFEGLDFGECIKITNCFIADNHRRISDRKMGRVNFNSGEFIITGTSFDNMRVSVDGDANVKIMASHFENPSSTSTNKRFLEVIGNHAYCILDKPQIVIRDTPIFSNLFYCKSGDTKNKHPWSAGLVLISPSYQSRGSYRPDLAPYNNRYRGQHESDGYLELVGGGGRVYLIGGAHINSIYYTYHPIPIARNLVGASIANHSFDQSPPGSHPKFWEYESINSSCEVTKEFSWIGEQSLKTSVKGHKERERSFSSIYQDIPCSHGQLCLGSIKCKWNTIGTGDISGNITVSIIFIDNNKNKIEIGYSKDKQIKNSQSKTEYKDWEHINLLARAPSGTAYARIELRTQTESNNTKKEIETYWDAATINVI